jgi:hypothetical protein
MQALRLINSIIQRSFHFLLGLLHDCSKRLYHSLLLVLFIRSKSLTSFRVDRNPTCILCLPIKTHSTSSRDGNPKHAGQRRVETTAAANHCPRPQEPELRIHCQPLPVFQIDILNGTRGCKSSSVQTDCKLRLGRSH